MSGLENGIRDIDDVHEKISAIQRSIRDFFAMEDALRGKGGDAIRYFFHEVHQPFLIFLYQSLQDYKTVLTKMQNVEAFEPNPSGLIRQDFLENEVTNGFDKVKDRALALTDDANRIIGSVQDLVAVDRIDDTAVLESVDRGKKKVRNIVEDMNALDQTQVQAMETVRADLQTMKRYLADVEAKVERGDLSPDNFNFGALRDVEGYSAMMEEIYGEEEWQVPREIAAKLANGKTLSPYEQDVLYDYFQNEFLDAGKRKEIEEIAGFISEDNIDNLKERLNKEVIISKSALEIEMAMMQAYLYDGNKKPDEIEIYRVNKSKLEAYLMLLKNYKKTLETIEENTIVQVVILNYENGQNNMPGHFFESTLHKAEYEESTRNVVSEKEFREYIFDPEHPAAKSFDISAVTYYTTADAGSFEGLQYHLEDGGLLEERANYTINFVGEEIGKQIVGQLGKAVGGFNTVMELQEGLKERAT
ncbi:hypothetical protein GCM10028868_38580 [Virgibacillus kimchii]